jgi:hypothetical protein
VTRSLPAVLLLALAAPSGARAEEGARPDGVLTGALEPEGAVDPDVRRYAPERLRFDPPELRSLPTPPGRRSWLVPLSEIAVADVVALTAARLAGKEWAMITPETVESNLRGPWTFDPNGFATNQLGHPYQGHVYYSAARSAGFSFWQSALFPAVASTLWELVAETEPPSINDAITTPVGGTVLGEVLFRLSRLVLDGGGLHPSAPRQVAAGLLSPPAGLTYALTGNRYRTRLAEPIPFAFEVRLGGSFSGSAYSEGEYTSTGSLVVGSLQVTHGLPSGDWRLREPFDHFDFYASVVAEEHPWAVLQARGLLTGVAVGTGASRRFTGLWGIYETTTLQTFRASTSAVGFGTTAQWAASSGIAIQGTALLAAGFGAAGSRVKTFDDDGQELTADYHYGAGGLALLEAKLLAADRGAVRLALRQYYVGGRVSPEARGYESVAYHTFGATLRVFGHHAVGLDVTRARRWAGFPERPDATAFNSFSQAIAYYAYVSDKTMGTGLEVASGAQR